MATWEVFTVLFFMFTCTHPMECILVKSKCENENITHGSHQSMKFMSLKNYCVHNRYECINV